MKPKFLTSFATFGRRGAFVGLALAGCLVGQFAQADVIVDTTDVDHPFSLSVIRRVDPKPKHWVYQAVAIAFSTPASDYTLDSIKLHTFGPNPTGTIAVDILADRSEEHTSELQ